MCCLRNGTFIQLQVALSVVSLGKLFLNIRYLFIVSELILKNISAGLIAQITSASYTISSLNEDNSFIIRETKASRLLSADKHESSHKRNLIMKKSMIVLLAAIVLSGCDQGSIFNAQQMEPDAVRRIESAGFDLRVYEFTPVTARNMTCVFVAGDRKGGLDCFPKPVQGR